MKNPIIGIIGGKGSMGSLFSNFFREHGLKVLVSDRNTKLTNKVLAAKADIVIVSVPMHVTEQVIKQVRDHLRPDAALMDITSIKERPVKEMMKSKCEVLGMHPMFGASNPIPGQTVILCKTKKSGHWSSWIEKFFAANKVKIQKMSPRDHDKLMNVAQGLIHFSDISFADAVRRCGIKPAELLKYTGKASELKLQLAARLLAQDPGLYAHIQIQNPQALKSLDQYLKSVQELRQIVAKKDIKKFEAYFKRTNKFLGNYSTQAYSDSSYLIDKLVEKRQSLPKAKAKRPTKKSIAVLGPEHSFSDLACQKYFEQSGTKYPKYFARDIDQIFELVEKGRVKAGIVPIENKLHGSVRESLDSLFYHKVHAAAQINLPIHHVLAILPQARRPQIKVVISHPQALNQCQKYLAKNFKGYEKEYSTSTTAAIQKLFDRSDPHLAVVAPEQAAKSAGLKIIASGIQDENDNSTTFLLIEKGDYKATKVVQKNRSKKQETLKTSIAFHFDKDSPGSLFSVFKVFADAKINLTKIESRPTKARFGDYIFYLDFEGSPQDTKVAKALNTVKKLVARIKIIGSYLLN